MLSPIDSFLQKTIRALWSKRRVETNGSFQNHPNSLEIVITWCYRKPFYIVFPPCKVSNPTYLKLWLIQTLAFSTWLLLQLGMHTPSFLITACYLQPLLYATTNEPLMVENDLFQWYDHEHMLIILAANYSFVSLRALFHYDVHFNQWTINFLRLLQIKPRIIIQCGCGKIKGFVFHSTLYSQE